MLAVIFRINGFVRGRCHQALVNCITATDCMEIYNSNYHSRISRNWIQRQDYDY